jgi:hypothetical protein
MANQEHLDILKQGVEVWNEWRETTEERPDLREADLRQEELTGANLVNIRLDGALLHGAKMVKSDLRGANLNRAYLLGTDLEEADLRMANLKGAFLTPGTFKLRRNVWFLPSVNLVGADLRSTNITGTDLRGVDLSRAVLNSNTVSTFSSWTREDISIRRMIFFFIWRSRFRMMGTQVGVNGIWVEITDSAALMTLTPPGDSMRGPNAEALVEGLRHARRIHSISLGLAAIGLGIFFQQTVSASPAETISLPFFTDLKFPVDQFSLLGMVISAGLLTLVKSFMDDALSGARYLQTRNDAMTVGTFPWALSRYTGRRWHMQVQSLITRLVLAFHPFAYVLLWDWTNWSYSSGDWYHWASWYDSAPWYHWGLIGVLFVFCIWIFVISQQFQRPILFDRRTEESRKSDLQALTEAVEAQTGALREVLAGIRGEGLTGRGDGADGGEGAG